MKKQHYPASKSVSDFDASIPLARLEPLVREWLTHCRLEFSPRTVEMRTDLMKRFLAFMKDGGYEECGLCELREFFAHLKDGHTLPGGRFGNLRLNTPLSANTLALYFRNLRAFFNWLVAEDRLSESSMERVARKRQSSDQVQPFTVQHVEALLASSRNTRHPRRDEAIVRVLLDTGVRCSELRQAKLEDLDFESSFLRIRYGKGGKERRVYFGRKTNRALWKYLSTEGRSIEDRPHEPLFLGDRGVEAGSALTRSGLFQLIQRLGEAAKIRGVRCSPHTFRHTHGVLFLRNGGNAISLKTALGHTTLRMTARYAAVSDADLQEQQRQFSPGDRLKS